MIKVEEKILLYASALWTFSEGMLGPLFAVFTEDIGGNVLDVSWAWAAFLIVSGVGIGIVGKLSDKMHRVKVMLTGYIFLTVFTFGYLFVSDPLHLLIVQIGLGLGLALSVPNWYALYDYHSGDGKHDGFIWGLAQGSWHAIRGLAILVGGAIVYYFSFDTLFWMMGIFMTLATIYQARLLWHPSFRS